MKQLAVLFTVLSTVALVELPAQGQCRLRMGGCSDPCGASACGRTSGCAVCGRGVRAASCASGYRTASGVYSVASNVSGIVGSCGSCGAAGMMGSQNLVGPQVQLGSQVQYAPQVQSLQAQNAELRTLADCMPITMYRVVLEPKYFTESKAVCSTEIQEEVRYRTRTVSRTEPVQVQDYRTKTIMVPKTETKTIEYSVLVPQTGEKTVELTETVPVWNEIPENYIVKVPKIDAVPEEYEVKVPQLRDEQFTYSVMVPQTETQTRMQTVTNAVPVTKTRTVEVCVPSTRMQTVTKDYGHWETRVDEVGVGNVQAYQPAMCAGGYANGGGVVSSAGGCGLSMGGCGTYAGSYGGCGTVSSGCGTVARRCGRCGLLSRHRQGCMASSGCGSCGAAGAGCGGCAGSAWDGGMAVMTVGNGAGYASGIGSVMGGAACDSMPMANSAPSTQAISHRVWVPKVVTEEVPVVENHTHTQEVAYTVYEQHSEQVPYECTYLVYRPETRTATRKVVDYVSEKRTRTRNVVSYIDETRTRTKRTMSYKQQSRTETIPVVSYRTEKRTKEVSFSFNVPEVQVEPFTSTRYETVSEEVTEQYTVKVPVATTKEVQVQVCRMVPRLVSYTASPCCDTNPQNLGGVNAMGVMNGGGCSGCGNQIGAVYTVDGSGCTGCAAPCNGCQGQ